MLIELMERFHPERIISIHGTHLPGEAGVSYDRRKLRPDEVQAAEDWANRRAYGGGHSRPQDDEGAAEARNSAGKKALLKQRLAEMSNAADQTDRDLSLKAANQIDAATASIKGREGRDMSRENEPGTVTKANEKARKAHPSIAGNVGPTGAIDYAAWAGGKPKGVSLGGYAPPRGMSVFTVEPPVDAATDKYPETLTADTPGARDEISIKAVDKLKRLDRKTELKGYADAIRTVLLGE